MTKETKRAWLVAGGMIAGFVLLGSLAQRSMNELAERRAPDCGDRTWALVGPDGASEAVPQRYVVSALQRGYRFPPSAERILVAPPYVTDECTAYQDAIPADPSRAWVWDQEYKFRGYRAATERELADEAKQERFGNPER